VPDQPAGAADQLLDVVLPPTKLRVLGCAMQVGPILGVRAGTPAARAGFQAGDVLVTIAGQEIGDPLTLAQRMLPLVGQEIKVGVRRSGGEALVALRVTPEPPVAYEENFGPGSLVALQSLGVAFRVEPVIQVVDAGGPAAEAGLRPGDEIVQAQFFQPDQSLRTRTVELFGSEYDRPIPLDGDLPNWPYVHAYLQLALPGMVVKLTYRRSGQERTVSVPPVESERWYSPQRGLHLSSVTAIRRAGSAAEAVALGYRETKERLREVLLVLRRLLTGKVAAANLGGPIAIASTANAEASAGIPRLLIFLTLLSVSLAVLHLLPIPGLDGGHLLFLAVEMLRGKPVSNKLQLILIAITVGGLWLASHSLLTPCLSQIFRFIGLLRTKR
jgi:regulator of sigma E protease